MTWQERLRNAAFVFSDGTRIEFIYEDFSSARDEQTTSFSFPGVDGEYIQRLSTGSNDLPVKMIFTGPDCDIEADNFEIQTISDKNPFIFEHPIRGDFNVQLLSLSRTDNIKSGYNEIIFNVSLKETISLSNPARQKDREKIILNNNDAIAEIAAADLKENSLATDVTTLNKLKDAYNSIVDNLKDIYNDVTATLEDVNAAFLSVDAYITNSIETIGSEIDLFAGAINRFLNIPLRAVESIERKIERLERAFDKFIDAFSFDNLPAGVDKKTFAKQIESMSCLVLANMTGAALSESDNFEKVSEIYQVIDKINAKYEIYLQQIDLYISATDGDDEESVYYPSQDVQQGITDSISLTAFYLQEISFKAQREISFILTENRDLFSLAYSIYGAQSPDELDAAIEKLVKINNIVGDELIILSAGREVVYYA